MEKISWQKRYRSARGKEYYTWNSFDRDVTRIVRALKKTGKHFDGVWGPPRGGLPLAIMLSHELGIPLLHTPKSRKTLIVDDMADTGETLKRFFGTHTIATLYYHPQSVVIPTVWIRKKGKRWVVFPWEKSS